MRTWPRILIVLLCFPITMFAQQLVTVQAAECPGGYSDSFQLDAEVNHPKTYTLPLQLASGWSRRQT
jgi:hypothetical protein